MSVTRHPFFAGHGDSRRFPSDRALAARLRASLVPLAPIANRLTRRFYERLFDARPDLRALFPRELDAQCEKLAATLWAVADASDDIGGAHGELARMGLDHAGYGARAEHYPIACAMLLASLVEAAGDAWDESTREDWRTALERISAAMLAGAARGR